MLSMTRIPRPPSVLDGIGYSLLGLPTCSASPPPLCDPGSGACVDGNTFDPCTPASGQSTQDGIDWAKLATTVNNVLTFGTQAACVATTGRACVQNPNGIYYPQPQPWYQTTPGMLAIGAGVLAVLYFAFIRD